jgi:hypothetical protein
LTGTISGSKFAIPDDEFCFTGMKQDSEKRVRKTAEAIGPEVTRPLPAEPKVFGLALEPEASFECGGRSVDPPPAARQITDNKQLAVGMVRPVAEAGKPKTEVCS